MSWSLSSIAILALGLHTNFDPVSKNSSFPPPPNGVDTDLQGKAVNLGPPRGGDVGPHRHAPRRRRELAPPALVDEHGALGLAEQVRPRLAGVVRADEHALPRGRVAAARHEHGEPRAAAAAAAVVAIAVPREAQLGWVVEVLGLRAVCVGIAREHHARDQPAAVVGGLVGAGGARAHGSEGAV